MSQNRIKITNQRKLTTKQKSDRQLFNSESIAAASPKKVLEREEKQKQSNPHSERLTAFPSQIKRESEVKQINTNKETSLAQVDYIVNQKWRSLQIKLSHDNWLSQS